MDTVQLSYKLRDDLLLIEQVKTSFAGPATETITYSQAPNPDADPPVPGTDLKVPEDGPWTTLQS